MVITDFHTHAFPDDHVARSIAEEAPRAAVGQVLDGRIASLVASMDGAGIDRSVVTCIATRPAEFDSILTWAKAISSERLLPFPSIHPDDEHALEHLDRVHDMGFRGIKLHPYYQEFVLDEKRMFPLYERAQKLGLVVLCHTGFDGAFPRVQRCDPVRIRTVVEYFPALRFVTSHLGAWQDWDDVREHLVGRNVLIELSYALDQMPEAEVRDLLLSHPMDYLLFGTDSPWAEQRESLELLRSFELGEERERAILSDTASRLLDA